MTEEKLSTYLDNYLNWSLGGMSEARDHVDEQDLARCLERDGYCQNPYTGFEIALCCSINKRREAECKMALCESYEFCRMLRREGYIN